MSTPRQPLLSIAVPTFNRRSFLNLFLNSVEAASTGSNWTDNDLEVVVGDNASSDGTSEMLAARAAKCPFRLVHFRNETNLGAVENVLRCVEQTTGRLVMVFGDDDEILPGVPEAVVAMAGRHPEVPLFCCSGADAQAGNWVSEETQISLEELAARYFYFPGNCGLAVVRGAAVRAAASELRRPGISPSSWVIMDLCGVAARLEGGDKPVVLSPLLSARYPNHGSNTIYLSHYLFSATWLGQTRSAANIDLLTGSNIAPLVCKSQLWGRPGLQKLAGIFVGAHMRFDLSRDSRETMEEAYESIGKIPIWGWPFCAGMLLLLALPEALKLGLLKLGSFIRFGLNGGAHFQNLMVRRATGVALRRAKLESSGASAGLYTKSSW